ncbi:MAG: hypothetical protein ACW99U_06870 [Candidatus Thorarchaeota archaeon]|jgi:hypothetical protein
MEFGSFSERRSLDSWDSRDAERIRRPAMNLAPLKGALETDPIRSRVLRLLIDDGGWVTTTDLLRTARKVRPIVGAVTIGTILNGINELVSSKLILSRTSLASGLEWAEWRINPDWLDPTRKLLRMLGRSKLFSSREDRIHETVQKILEDSE